MLKIIFGIKVEDANAPFRLMKSSLLAKYIDRLPVDYSIPNIMFTTYWTYYNEKIEFKTISFKPRQKGTNTIKFTKIIKIGWKSLLEFIGFKKEMKSF